LGKLLLDDAGDRIAVLGVLVDDGDGSGLLARRLLLLEKLGVSAGKIARDWSSSEEPLEAAFREVGGNRLRRQKWNSMPLGDGTGRHRDARLIGADEGYNRLLGDEAQRLVLTSRRRALIVCEDDLDLGPAEPRQTLAVGQRHLLQFGIAAVDEID